MNAIKIGILSISFLIVSIGGTAQEKQYASPGHIRKMARTAESLGDVYTAIDLYKTFLTAKPDNLKVSFRLAECYRQARDYENAMSLYKKLYDANPKKYGATLFYYGQMLMQQGKYADAKKVFVKFKKVLRTPTLKNKRYLKKMYKVMLKACDLAPVLKDSALKVLIYHLDTSVNKAHIEASPLSLSADTLLYSSLRSDKITYYNIEDTTVKPPVRKFYVATGQDAHWTTTGAFKGPFNDTTTNVANGAFSPDGSRFYFTKTTQNKAGKIISQIYVSQKTSGIWSSPKRLDEPINDPFYTSTQPTVGIESKKNREVVYFVSDRPGGKGGTDIWYFLYDKTKDRYSRPRKAGSKLNTVGNEMTPYFDMTTHTLYFSSDGYPGLGGLDIFKTTGELNKWSPPLNMGYPINTEADDLYFTISKNRETGFFTSNRKGGVALKNPTCCDDLYSFRWTQYIHIAIRGIVFAKYNIAENDTIEQVLAPAPESPTQDSVVADSLLTDTPIQHTADSTILTDSLTVVSSADSVARTFVPKTHETDSTILLDSAQVSLLLEDSSEGKPVEYLIETFNTASGGEYGFQLERGNRYRLVVEKAGYFNGIVDFSTEDINRSDTLIRDIELKKIPMKAIVLENIYYKFDKADLTAIAKKTIDSLLYPILKDNPKLIVEISSHTDSKGNDDYNKRLSQRRAESVVDYLIREKGIDARRLVAKGYGESKPIAPNTNPDGSDNPKGRAKNRRTEFKIIGSSNQFSKINYIPLKVNQKQREVLPPQEK